MQKFVYLAFLPFFFYACTVIQYDVREERREEKDFSSAQIQKVEIKTENGNIESSTWDLDYIHVVFEKSATGYNREAAWDNIDAIKISANVISGVLDLDVSIPNHPGANSGCSVYLNLPSYLSLSLHSSNGAIKVIDSQNDFYGETSNGNITIYDTRGKATLRTSNGKIVVRDHKGELDVKTSNAKVDVDIVLPFWGECILKTSNAPITLSIPDTTSANIEAKTSNGEVEMENLDVTITKMQKTELNARIGTGKGKIVLETSNSDILIR